MNSNFSQRIAASLALLAVGLGAFGAHALKPHLEQLNHLETWKTAVLYHLVHAVVLFFLTSTAAPRRVIYAFVAGIILFSGSLYLISTLSWKWLGPVTPVGGLCFMAGWLMLALKPPPK